MNIRTTAVAALIFVVLYNLLFFRTQPGIGTGLLFLLLNLYFFTVKDNLARNLFVAVLASIISIIFAFLLSFRANGIVQLIDIAAAIFFSLVALYFYKYHGSLSFQLTRFISLPFVAAGNSISGFFKLFKADNYSLNPVEYKGTGSLIRGLIITVPIFAVLLLLLSQADPIFNKLTQNLFSGIGERTIKSIIIFLGLLGFGLATFKLQEYPQETQIAEGKSYELAMITGTVLVLFAAFILVQFKYLFSSVDEQELAQLGIASLTYSEYVRKGFFELLIAASIACGLLLYVLRHLGFLQHRSRLIVNLFSNILTIETGFLLLSAAKRLMLYTDAHGLTRARVFGAVFLLWLGILLTILLVSLLKKIKQQWFFASILTATLFVLVLINILNIDGLIADLYKPTVNGETDYYYLSNLSSDAADSWQPAIEDAAETISRLGGGTPISAEQNRQLYYRNHTLIKLGDKFSYLIHKYGTREEIIDWDVKSQDLPLIKFPKLAQRKWQSFNLSEYLSYKKIAANLKYYGQITILLNKISVIKSTVSTEVNNNTLLDRSTQPPLVR